LATHVGLGIGALQQQGAEAQAWQVHPLALNPYGSEAAGGLASGAHLAVVDAPGLGAGGEGGSAGQGRGRQHQANQARPAGPAADQAGFGVGAALGRLRWGARARGGHGAGLRLDRDLGSRVAAAAGPIRRSALGGGFSAALTGLGGKPPLPRILHNLLQFS
jgi:hypothetical protein